MGLNVDVCEYDNLLMPRWDLETKKTEFQEFFPLLLKIICWYCQSILKANLKPGMHFLLWSIIAFKDL